MQTKLAPLVRRFKEVLAKNHRFIKFNTKKYREPLTFDLLARMKPEKSVSRVYGAYSDNIKFVPDRKNKIIKAGESQLLQKSVPCSVVSVYAVSNIKY